MKKEASTNNKSLARVEMREAILRWLFAAVLLLIPFVKIALFRRITIVEPLFVVLAFAVFIHIYKANPRLLFVDIEKTGYWKVLPIWAMAILLSALNARYLDAYLYDAIAYIYLGCFTLLTVLICMQSERLLGFALRCVKTSVVVVVLIGGAGTALMLLAIEQAALVHDGLGNLIGTFRNPNQLAAFLVLFMPLFIEGILGSRTLSGRILHGALVIALLALVILSASRAGLVAAIAALAIYLLIQFSRLNARAMIGAGVTALALLFAAVLLKDSVEVIARVIHAFELIFLQGQFTDPFRVENWSLAISLFRQYPITGYGLGNIWIDNGHEIHNTYLAVLAEMGIVGIIALGTLLVYITYLAIRNIQLSELLSLELLHVASRALFVGLFCYYLIAIQHVVLRHRQLWLVFGLIIAMNYLLKERLEKSGIEDPQSP